MQFSKTVQDYARNYALDVKDVLLACGMAGGATAADMFAVLFRPPVSSASAMTSRASKYIGSKPAIRKLINELQGRNGVGSSADRQPSAAKPSAPSVDLTKKEVLMAKLAEEYEGADKSSDRLAILKSIADLNIMKKQEVDAANKTVYKVVPLTFTNAQRLLNLLEKWEASQS